MQFEASSPLARLLITCPDRPGIIAKVTSFLQYHGANITDLDQHSTASQPGTFFMRLEFQTSSMSITGQELNERFAHEVALPLNMKWEISYAAHLKRLAVFVSKYDHAFLEILWRWSRKELPLVIPFVISNHPNLSEASKHFQLPYHYIPVDHANKNIAEEQMLALCQKSKVDGIILARYMQILSKKFISHYPQKIINIHHSFLPAFVGANPYQQAYDKGVKLIGATAHYVTEELDMGPIIAQDVIRVTHRLDANKLRELGQAVEKMVLARAVEAHLEDRIIVHSNKTIVFEKS